MTTKAPGRFASALAELEEARAEAFARHIAPIDAAIAGLQALTPAPASINGDRPRAVKAAKPGKRGQRAELTEATWARGVKRCLQGEKVAAVARDLGVGYGALYPRVAAARKVKPAKEQPSLLKKPKAPAPAEDRERAKRVCRDCGEWTTEDPCEHCLEPAP